MTNLKYIYSSIKNNNLAQFQKLTENLDLNSFVNNINENFLFYALDKGSYEISQYLIDKNPEFLLSKNKYLLTPFSNIVFNNNIKGLKCFLKIQNNFKIDMDKLVNLGGETYTVPLLAIEKLNKQNWKIFEILTESFWHSSNLSSKDLNGYNIVHKLAIDNKDYAISILKHLDDSLFYQSDSELNLTPIFYASQFSSFNLFKEILNKSNIQDKNLLNSNLIHAAIFNNDINVLKHLTSELSNININFLFEKNAYGDSPLMTAINNKNINAVNHLFKFYIDNKIDISDELIEYIKNFQKNPTLFKKYFQNITFDNIKNLLESDEKLTFLFSYVFFHFSEKDLIKIKKQLKLIDKISTKNIYFGHQLYSASILSKKDIAFKFDMLMNKFKILNSNKSEKYFSYDISSTSKLSFQNYDYQLFNKPTKVFSFISLLNTLPNNQLNDFIDKFNILNLLDNNDLVYLYFISIKKQNIGMLEKLRNNKYSTINENTFLIIQDLLGDYTFKEEQLLDLNVIFNTFPRKPSYLINNISNNYLNNKITSYLNNYVVMFQKNDSIKKELFLNILFDLYSKPIKDIEYFKFFLSNDNMIVLSFKNMTVDKINNLKLSNFLKKSLTNYFKRENPIFLLLQVASSSNIEKKELIDFILPYCTFNSSVFLYLKNKSNLNIDENIWTILFEKIESQNIKDLSYIYLNNTNIKNINIDFISDKINKNDIINYILSQEELDFNKLNLLMKKYSINSNDIFNNDLIYENIPLLDYCINENNKLMENVDYLNLLKIININTIDIDFQNNSLFNNSQLNLFFSFLSKNNGMIEISNKEIILNYFVNYLKNDNINHQVSIRIINTLLNTFEDSISKIDDSLLVDVCKHFILKNNILTNDEFNNIFSIIFDKKGNKLEFFNLLENEKDFKKNITYLPSKEQKVLFLNELKNDLKPIPQIKPIKKSFKI